MAAGGVDMGVARLHGAGGEMQDTEILYVGSVSPDGSERVAMSP